MSSTPPPVAIAVVSWNTRDLLARCLDSVWPEVQVGRASVTVVDNGSSDGSRKMVRGDYPWVDLLEPNENLGFGRAVNLVAARTTSPWLAAANADTEMLPRALEALLGAGERAPDAGAIAPRLVLADGSTQHSVHSFPSPRLATLFGLGLHRLSARYADHLCIEGYWNPDRRRSVDWAHGAFLLIRRACFDQVGGFDEAQWMYAEDIDLGWRLKAAGHPIHYEPRARVRHAVSASTRKAFTNVERDRRHVVASYRWLARRRGPAVARVTARINIAGAGLRFLALTPLVLLGGSRCREPRHDARRYLALHRAGLRATHARGLAPEGPDESLSADRPAHVPPAGQAVASRRSRPRR